MERHCAANQTVIQLEKTLTDNTDTGAVPRWYDTTAHYQTYVTGQIFKQLHDKADNRPQRQAKHNNVETYLLDRHAARSDAY